jgi:pyruvate,water dikinase
MTFMGAQLVRSLDDARAEESEQSGSKAATLAELKRAGFRVPEGFVVTTEALTQALAQQIHPAHVRRVWRIGRHP